MESEEKMTREKKEQISNRLVLNFGVLLAAALVLLYVRSALSSTISNVTYIIIAIIGVLCLAGSIVMFVLGKKNSEKLKNYSAIPFGTFIGCAVIYCAKLGFISGYSWNKAVIAVYILMAVYFVIMAIITAVLLKKPTIKNVDEKELARKKNKKKKRK